MVFIKLIAKTLKHVMEPSSWLLLLVTPGPFGTSVAVAISLNAARHVFFSPVIMIVMVVMMDDDGGWFGSCAGLLIC